MDNNNPAEMSNYDLEKDMEQKNLEAKRSGNQEFVNKSSASEGRLKTPDQDEGSIERIRRVYTDNDERDLDDLVHASADEEEDSQDGSLPDPEELDNWERRDDPNKVSG
jgi:hypothetical protein